MSTIERSAGLPITVAGLPTGYVSGGGFRGSTAELDRTVERAAATLRDAYDRDVTIRFNSDRQSGGAWVVTDAVDGFGANAELGIGAALRDGMVTIFAHVGSRALVNQEMANAREGTPRAYYHGPADSIGLALRFLRAHGSLDWLEQAGEVA